MRLPRGQCADCHVDSKRTVTEIGPSPGERPVASDGVRRMSIVRYAAAVSLDGDTPGCADRGIAVIAVIAVIKRADSR